MNQISSSTKICQPYTLDYFSLTTLKCTQTSLYHSQALNSFVLNYFRSRLPELPDNCRRKVFAIKMIKYFGLCLGITKPRSRISPNEAQLN